ncbi:MAG: hypothetical protein IJ735_04815 [Clostridia bacterium]|nr:hypothetical protein [Clostridia bacterium]
MAKKKQQQQPVAPVVPPRRIRVKMVVVNPTGKPVPVAKAVKDYIGNARIAAPIAQPSLVVNNVRRSDDEEDDFDF